MFPSKVTIEAFKRAHVREMELGAQAHLETVNVPNFDAALRLFEIGGPSFTGRINGKIAGCGGLILFSWPGVAEAWVMATTHAATYPVTWCRTFRFMLDKLVKDYSLRRVQAQVQEDFERGRRWIELLGFHSEGVMPHYGPNGEAFVMYAYFPKEMPKP